MVHKEESHNAGQMPWGEGATCGHSKDLAGCCNGTNSFLHAGWDVLTTTVFLKLVWFFHYHFLKEPFKIISSKDGYINKHYMYLFISIIYILHSIKLYIFTTWLYYIYV